MSGTVRQITRNNGDARWRVTVPNGRGGSTRKEFRTEEQAQTWHRNWIKDREKQGKVFASLRESDQAALVAAWEVARDGGFSVMDAVNHYARFLGDQVTLKQTVELAVCNYIEDCLKRGLKDRSVGSIKNTLEPFASRFGNLNVDEVSAAHISQWIDFHPQWSARTVNNCVLRLGGFFRWAREHDLTNAIPVRKSHRRKVESETPGVFTAAEAQHLLDTAFKMDKGIAGLLAVQLFAGLRPAEAADPSRSGLDKVDLDARELWVKGKVERQRRIVKISDNLAAWLEACGDWAQTNVRRRLDAVREAAGIEWSHDITRHSFASYHLAQHEDAAKTAHEMGHAGNSTILWQHYRAVVRRDDANAFWKILPVSK